MPTYPVNEPLKHDGQGYGPGETVEMDAKAAKELLALGALGPAIKATAKAEPKAKAESKPAETGAAETSGKSDAAAAASGAGDGTGENAAGQEEGK